MNIILTIFAIFSLTFLIKNSDGPFGIMNWIRIKLINSYCGVFFYKLLECSHCVGFYSGMAVYCLTFDVWHWQYFVVYALAGGGISLLSNAILEKLWK